MKSLLLILLFLSASCTKIFSPSSRAPASSVGDDPCRVAMMNLLDIDANTPVEFIDDVISVSRVVESGRISMNDVRAVESSAMWREFIDERQVDATLDEQVLVIALLRNADPDAPVDVVKRKYNLLFEFCGL